MTARASHAYADILPAGGDTAMPLNLRKRLQLLQRHAPLRGQRVLDCGCGRGEYVAELLRLRADAYGIEYSADKVHEAHPDVAARISVGDLGNIDAPDGSVDVVLLNEVLEHVPDERRVLSEIYRVLAPGGRLVLFSPNRRYPFETHGSALKGSGRKVPHFVPFIPYIPLPVANTVLEFWARNYWPRELRRIVADSGLAIVHTDYVWQTFENISGRQPRLLTMARPVLRRLSSALESLPLVRSLGVSQLIVAQKPGARAATAHRPGRSSRSRPVPKDRP
jgi:ubiquinone/menaquinone biosynthesis C-methylase UbiE